MIIEKERLTQAAQSKWNAGADAMNQWAMLGQDERDALIAAEAPCAAPKTSPGTELIAAAQAVIDRWDSLHWQDQLHTAECIDRLRAAVKEKAQ